MKVIDVFPFFNELDVLKIRLEELSGIVDKFVIVEAPYTFMMKEKPFYFQKNRELFERYEEELISLTIPKQFIESIQNSNPWLVERAQRNYSAAFLNEVCEDNDVIIFSDVDEIPSEKQVDTFKKCKLSGVSFSTRLYRYYLNLYFQPWNCCHMFRWVNLKQYINNFDDIRKTYRSKFFNLSSYPGWHFTSIGTIDQVWEKVTNFAHAKEHAKKGKLDKDKIAARMRQRLHPFKDRAMGKVHPVDKMPQYVQNNIDLFNNLILEA